MDKDYIDLFDELEPQGISLFGCQHRADTQLVSICVILRSFLERLQKNNGVLM